MKPLSLLAAVVLHTLAGVSPATTIDASKFPNLQAALDAVPEAGGLVSIPPGLYEITEPLRVKTADTRIVGSGAATHIQNKNEQGAPAFILRPANLDEDKKARLWRVQMADLRISGSEKSGDGIFAECIQEIYLEGVSIDHHGGHGIQLKSCFEDPRIADCILTYNKKCGIEIFDCHDIVVNANHFEENQDALVCVDAFNLCMNGNNIDDHLGHGVVIENTYGSVVSGNMIEECNGTAIILDRDCYGITLSANVIAHDMGGGIDLRDAHGITVSANNFTLMHHFGVRVSENSGRIAISANHFGNSHIGAGQEKRLLEHKDPVQLDIGQGVVLEKTKGITISGNQFTGLDGPAVRTTGACEKILIDGNLTSDLNRRTPDSKEPFALSPETKATLSDNLTD
jgi:parallel beta-helix repeat protein